MRRLITSLILLGFCTVGLLDLTSTPSDAKSFAQATAAATTSASPTSSAAPATPSNGAVSGCQPLDVVLVIDQSDSMATNSDPANLRLEAVKDAMTEMFNTVALYCPDVTDQVAVVGFGDTTSVMLPFSPINVPDINGQWNATLGNYIGKVVPQQSGQTHVAGAFEQAAKLIATTKQTDKHAVILVTDGMPCNSTGKAGVKTCADPAYIEHYFYANQGSQNPYWVTSPNLYGFDTSNGMINDLDSILPTGGNSTVINVLMFGVGSGRFPIVDKAWGQITQSRNGVYVPPEQLTPDTLTNKIHGMIDDLLKVPVERVQCDQSFYLQPYVSSTTIIANIGPQSALGLTQIVDPNGVPLAHTASTNVDYTSLKTAERFTIKDPIPGKWTVKSQSSKCADIAAVDVRVQTAAPTASFQPVTDAVVSLDSPYFSQDSQSFATVLVTDRFGKPVESIPSYPLMISGQITGPIATQPALAALKPISFSALQGQPGLWRSDTPLPAPGQGQYTLVLTAQVKDADPSQTVPQKVFVVPGVYKTQPPVAIQLTSLLPEDGGDIRLNLIDDNKGSVNNPFDVKIKVQTVSDKRDQPIVKVFRGDLAKVAIQASLYKASNLATAIEKITLTPDPTDPNVLTGKFRADSPTPLDESGKYSIVYSLTQDGQTKYNQDNYKFDPQATVTINIQRAVQTGLTLKVVNQPVDQLLNTLTADGKPQPQTIPVSIQLVDESGKPLKTSDVFSTSIAGVAPDKSVYAQLIGPDGKSIEDIPLTPDAGQDGVFKGELRTGQSNLDKAGDYQLAAHFGNNLIYDTKLFARTTKAPATIPFKRSIQTAIKVTLTSPSQDDPIFLDTLASDGKMKATNVTVTIKLIDPNQSAAQASPISPDAKLSADKMVQDVVSVQLLDSANNKVAEQRLSDGKYNPNNGLVTINIPIPQTEVDKQTVSTITTPPKYTIQLVADTNAISANPNPLAPYALLSASGDLPSITVKGESKIQLSLVLEQLGGVKIDDPTKAPDSIPTQLYLSIGDAFADKVNPVAMVFALRDSKNQPYNLSDVISGACDATGCPALTLSTLAPGLTDKVPVTDVTVDTKTYDHPVIIVKLPPTLLQNGSYTLAYQAANNAFKSYVTIASATANTQNFTREISGPLNNPAVWRAVKLVISVIVGLLILIFILNLIRVNFLPRMKGSVKLTLDAAYSGDANGSSRKVTTISRLGRIKILRNQVTEKVSAFETATRKQVSINIQVIPSNLGSKVEQYQVVYPKPAGKTMVRSRIKPGTNDNSHQIEHTAK